MDAHEGYQTQMDNATTKPAHQDLPIKNLEVKRMESPAISLNS